jgi:subfamily B ATP-binding cassette protein MsbA
MTASRSKSIRDRVRALLVYGKASVSYLREAFKKTSYQRKKLSRDDMLFLLQFLKPVWKLGLASIFLVILVAALQSIMPLNTKFFIDYIVGEKSTDGVVSLLNSFHLGVISPLVVTIITSLPFLIAFMIALTISYSLLDMLQGFIGVKFQQEMIMNVQMKLFDHILRFPLTFFKNRQTGYLLSRISQDVDSINSLFSIAVLFMIQNFLYLVFSFAILFTINVKLTLIALCVIPPYLLVNSFFGYRMRSVNYRERESNAQVSRDIQEALSGVEVIKTYNTEDREVKKVSEKVRDVMEARKIGIILSSASNFIMRSAQFIFTLVIMWFGYQEIKNGTLSIGDYVAFTTYVAMMSGSINNIFSSYLGLQRVLVSVDRVMEMFRMVPESDEDKDLIRPERVVGNIQYNHVSFAYEADRPVLNDISFAVAPGNSITIVGPSGAGKSTIVNLLLKFYTPQSGTIYLDGVDLRNIERKWLRDQVGIVSQDIFLFNDTIENNIKYGRLEATHEEVEMAARRAHIHDDIVKLPNGYNTIIGEKGVKLSVGQRQRVSIARAFLKNTPILILDEPTSSIDPGIENLIRDSLRELTKGRTTIVISHRMSFANKSDHILVIQNGRLVEEGNHEELICKNGLYHKLCSPEI